MEQGNFIELEKIEDKNMNIRLASVLITKLQMIDPFRYSSLTKLGGILITKPNYLPITSLIDLKTHLSFNPQLLLIEKSDFNEFMKAIKQQGSKRMR